jgi:hypothetical protein
MRRRRLYVSALVAALALALGLLAGPATVGNRPAAARAASPQAAVPRAAQPLNRYSLVHGCFALQSAPGSGGAILVGPHRMQATSLGQYLLYGSAQDFLAAAATPAMVASPSVETVWRVDGDARTGFTITNPATGIKRAVSFTPASGCATYPASVDATGVPFSGPSPQAQVTGTIDAHTHVPPSSSSAGISTVVVPGTRSAPRMRCLTARPTSRASTARSRASSTTVPRFTSTIRAAGRRSTPGLRPRTWPRRATTTRASSAHGWPGCG